MIDTSKWFTHFENKQQTIDFLIDYFKRQDLILPDDFVEFYKENNGVIISDDCFEFHLNVPADFSSQDELFFDCFYDVENIIDLFEFASNWSFPKNMITFTNGDPGFIVLSLSTSSHGMVFFCESDILDEQIEYHDSVECIIEDFDYPNKPLPKIMFKIADSFTEFLDKIEVRES